MANKRRFLCIFKAERGSYMNQIILYLSEHPEAVDALLKFAGVSIPLLILVKIYLVGEDSILNFIFKY